VHVVIMGCGRVGSTLADEFEALGHTVAVIDQDPRAFRRLGPHFAGQTVTGMGFDRDTLNEARTQQAAAFAAVSSGDNSNILAARVARETFGVERVAARIYDPDRAEVYSRLGIPTVGTVRWTADQMMRRLLPEGSRTDWVDGTGTIRLAQASFHPGWVGSRLSRVEEATGVRAAFLDRFGAGVLPGTDTVLQEGDVLHVLMHPDQTSTVESVLAASPEAS
jgi:trk system potassium uptake protein TrkA